MEINKYALIRVSTEEQNEARQVIAMSNLGILKKNIVIEKESGKSTVRTKYHRLVKRLQEGDILYIENVDRLSRDYDGIVNEWYILTKQKGVIIKVIDTPMLDTDRAENDLLSRFMRNILLHTHAYQSENEWIKIKNRQAQGIAVAKASGKQFGRPKIVYSDDVISTVKKWRNGDIELHDAMKLLNRKKSSFYKLVEKVEQRG